MYYPKSQIKTNLYTKGGEFISADTQSNYVGYYYETSKGKKFTGKNPSLTPSVELIPSISLTSNLDEQLETDNYWANNFPTYNPQINKNLSKANPKQTFPHPTSHNYQTGEFERYFLKKSNEAKFIEISKEDYEMYISKNNSVPYELYKPTKISWVLKGNKDQVYQANKNIVGKVEREQKYYGFSSYFKDNFTQFYQ